MILYTCMFKKGTGFGHACGTAAKALDDAGIEYELRTVGGVSLLPFTTRGKRDEVERLTGQKEVPVLALDDGTAIAGSKEIVAWAGEQHA